MPIERDNQTVAYSIRTDLQVMDDAYVAKPREDVFAGPPIFSKVNAIIYRQGGVGFAPAVGNSLKTAVFEMVVSNIEQFCNDYLSKNPDKIKISPPEKKPIEDKPTAKKPAPKK
jgi:hypothetical protein